MLLFALTIFLSAFLLFQVQPLLGRFVLPWFGGGPGVWTVCMLLFQVLLLAGYAYAHLLTTYCSRRFQSWAHLTLLAASICALPIIPDASWKPAGADAPTLRILALLAATVGLPYFLLSTTGPLVQRWFADKFPTRSPFRLYALSNVASLLALISYPLAVEPMFTLGTQAVTWSLLYGVFVALCAGIAGCRLRESSEMRSLAASSDVDAEASATVTPIGTKVLWLLLAATASVMLLATTSQLCQQVAVTPFLWIAPLAIYLVSFILTFDSDRWYRRDVFGPLLAIAAVAAWYAVDNGPAVSLELQLLIYCTTLFAACMVCHGELVRLRPAPRQLTLFYLIISLGGALGGILTACVAPLLFKGYWEYQIGMAAACLLLLVCLDRDRRSPLHRLQPLWAWCGLACAAIAFFTALGKQAWGRDDAELTAARNFYGVLRVIHRNVPAGGPQVAMIHGRVVHGVQSLDAAKRNNPTSYYGPTSGIGIAIERHPDRRWSGEINPLKIGVVGLGAGTIAAYGREGDVICFYEINPEVERLAQKHFQFLADSKAKIEIVLGDARMKLEEQFPREGVGIFDVLAVDAFSGDAIPMHLLTRECFAVYRRALKPDGILALHVSNDHVDLAPVVRGLAAEVDWDVVLIQSEDDPAAGTQRSDWLIATRNNEFLNATGILSSRPLDLSRPAIIWTDDFGSLRQVLK